MTVNETHDITNHFVSDLPLLMPRADRAERVRAVCRARLERDRRRSKRVAAISRFGRHVVAPAVAAGLVAFYAADVVSITLRTFAASD